MEILNGTKVVAAWEKMIIPGWIIFNSQTFALWDKNGEGGENDRQLQLLLDAYSSWRDPNGRTILEVIREG